MAEKILAARNLVVRHATLELIEHWAIALSGLVLLLTGIFELPVAKRYYIITVSGLVKTYKNIYAPDMSHTVLLMATWIHNIFFVFPGLSRSYGGHSAQAQLADGSRHLHGKSPAGLCPAPPCIMA